MSRPTPVGRIVIRPSDDTKAIIGITKGADPSLKPGMVYEIRKDDSGVMTLHEVGESCIRGPIKDEDTRPDAVFSWAHDLGLIIDQMGVECVAAIGEPRHRAQLDIIMQHQKHDRSYPNMRALGYAGLPVLEFFFPAFAAAHSKPKELEDELHALFCTIDDGNHDGADQMIKVIGKKWTEKLSELVLATVSNQRKRACSEQKERKS